MDINLPKPFLANTRLAPGFRYLSKAYVFSGKLNGPLLPTAMAGKPAHSCRVHRSFSVDVKR
jgi:hypothetical protein